MLSRTQRVKISIATVKNAYTDCKVLTTNSSTDTDTVSVIFEKISENKKRFRRYIHTFKFKELECFNMSEIRRAVKKEKTNV